MITLNITDDMREDLQRVVMADLITTGIMLRRWRLLHHANRTNELVRDFSRLTHLLATLNSATSSNAQIAPATSDAARHLNHDGQKPWEPHTWMDETARAEGINLDRELNDIDPRASHPRCVHGRAFTEPCDYCGSDLAVMASLPPEGSVA